MMKYPLHIQMSSRRLWMFRLLTACLAPVLFLVLLEGGLRIIGYGFPVSTFVKCEINGHTFWCSNNRFGWRFFPREISRALLLFTVKDEKPANTYRIFILGESAAEGDPMPAFSFGRQLQVLLREQYPQVNFEVFTAATVAINSHVIVKIAEDCSRLKPDLFIIYMGNNEVVGPYGAGTIFTPLSKNLFLIRAGIAIKATRAGQLLARLTEIADRNKQKSKKWAGLEMFSGKQIQRDDPRLEYVYTHFRRNLEDIIKTTRQSGANVILSTVAVNLRDCAPFASMHRDDLGNKKTQFDTLYNEGIELENKQEFQSAIDRYLAADEIDNAYAELQFRLGRCFWNLGQFDKARERYVKAMELDTLRFRADGRINRIIREVGAGWKNHVVEFVDAADAFAKSSPRNTPGRELFFEHVHLTFSGNYLLAKTVFESMENILPDRIKAARAADTGLPDQQDCANQLGFTVFEKLDVLKEVQRILSRPPYTNQAYYKETVAYYQTQIQNDEKAAANSSAYEEAVDIFEKAIHKQPDDAWLRSNYFQLLITRKKYRQAVEHLKVIIGLNPNPRTISSLVVLADFENISGENDSALNHAFAALKIDPANTSANDSVGTAYQKKGLYDKAERYFTKAIEIDPEYTFAYIHLGQLLMEQRKFKQAEKIGRKAIQASPNDAVLHVMLAQILQMEGLMEEAEVQRQKAILLDPNLAHPANPKTGYK
ncbi:MAG: tetratricopeptide repeat protein [Sedimentisphaerales bacterium]